MNLTRREFIVSTGATIVSSKIFGQTRKRVLILGAGLSGLAAAYELALKDFNVTVVEARNRAGGRVFTLREPFQEGQYVELGGELIGDGYRRFLSYADKFNIKYEEVSAETQTGGSVTSLQKGIGTSAVLKGELYPAGASIAKANPYNLPPDEANDLPPTILFKHILAIASEVRAAPHLLGAYDELSLADALRKRNVSREMIRLMNISLNYNSIETVSTAGVLLDARRRFNAGTKAIRLRGGNEKLPQALYENAKRGGARFVFNARVKRISHDAKQARVSFQNEKGETETLEAEKLICTIPFSVLRDVEFAPALPETKARAIRELAYTRITKVFLQGERAEWDKRNLGSSVWTDTALERIFSAAGRRSERMGIFTVWTDGEGASFPEGLTDEQRIVWARSEFQKLLPFITVRRAATKSWTNDQFARGAYAHFTVNQFNDFQPILRQSVGALHFAGEHTAEKSPGMEAALESAERVVGEIVNGQ